MENIIGQINFAFEQLKISLGKEKPAEALSAIDAITKLFNEQLSTAQNGKARGSDVFKIPCSSDEYF